MDVNHPEIEDFIDIKTDLNRVTKANISVRVDDEFMNKVINNGMCAKQTKYSNKNNPASF